MPASDIAQAPDQLGPREVVDLLTDSVVPDAPDVVVDYGGQGWVQAGVVTAELLQQLAGSGKVFRCGFVLALREEQELEGRDLFQLFHRQLQLLLVAERVPLVIRPVLEVSPGPHTSLGEGLPSIIPLPHGTRLPCHGHGLALGLVEHAEQSAETPLGGEVEPVEGAVAQQPLPQLAVGETVDKGEADFVEELLILHLEL